MSLSLRALAVWAAIGCHHRGAPGPPEGLAQTPPPSPPHCAGAERHRVDTADGAQVGLHRHRAPGPPVLVVHGISSNHRFWDLDPESSLALALQAAGFDAWLLDLRGHGLAERDEGGHRSRVPASIDAYGQYDLDAAIRHVQAHTGAERVALVGHSLGGMVAAIYQSWHGDQSLGPLIVVGSPVEFGHPDRLMRLAALGTPLGAAAGRMGTPALAKMAARMRKLPLDGDDLLFAEGSLDADTRARMYRNIVSPMYRGEFQQLSALFQTGHLVSSDRSRDYLADLSGLTVPLLVIAGRADRIAPADRVEPWMRHVSSPDRSFVLAGRVNGMGHDYGHLDLGVGPGAASEIHPVILGWLVDRWPPAD